MSNQVYFEATDELIRLPGLPPMYDYEYYPQTVPIFIQKNDTNH